LCKAQTSLSLRENFTASHSEQLHLCKAQTSLSLRENFTAKQLHLCTAQTSLSLRENFTKKTDPEAREKTLFFFLPQGLFLFSYKFGFAKRLDFATRKSYEFALRTL
jgi:hypothetical protein